MSFIFVSNYQKLNNQKADSATKLSEIANKTGKCKFCMLNFI